MTVKPPSRRRYAPARVGLACWAAFSGLNAQAATGDALRTNHEIHKIHEPGARPATP